MTTPPSFRDVYLLDPLRMDLCITHVNLERVVVCKFEEQNYPSCSPLRVKSVALRRHSRYPDPFAQIGLLSNQTLHCWFSFPLLPFQYVCVFLHVLRHLLTLQATFIRYLICLSMIPRDS